MATRKLDCPREECGEAWDPKVCFRCAKLLTPSGACLTCGDRPRTDVCWRCLREGVESRGVPRTAGSMYPPAEDELAELRGWYAPLLLVYAAFATLGQDANGRPLWTEQVAWLDEHGVRDPYERGRWAALWRVVAAEKGRALAAKLEN